MSAFDSRPAPAPKGEMAPQQNQLAEKEALSFTPAVGQAMVSYSVGIAIMQTANGPVAISLREDIPPNPVRVEHMLFRGYAGQTTCLKVHSPEELRKLLEIGHAKDRGLQMMLILIERDDDRETRVLAGEFTEVRLQLSEVEDFIANRLHRTVLKADSDIETALQLARENGWARTEVLLNEINKAQPVLQRLGDSLKQLPSETIESAGWQSTEFAAVELAAAELADSGVTRSFCRVHRGEETDADRELLQAAQEKNPGLRDLLTAWTAELINSLVDSKNQSPQG